MDWIKVSERMPPVKRVLGNEKLGFVAGYSSEPLLMTDGKVRRSGIWTKHDDEPEGYWVVAGFGNRLEVTHWMPWPDLPKGA